MAFKPVSMADSVSYVSTYDPAVDRRRICERELEKHDELKDSGISENQRLTLVWQLFEVEFAQAVARDPSESQRMLLFKDGGTPTVFVLGAVSSEDFNRIVDETAETKTWRGAGNQRLWRMFLHGLRDIQGWPTPVPKRKVGDLEYVDTAWLRKTFVRDLRDVAIQIGNVIAAYNRLTEEEIKN